MNPEIETLLEDGLCSLQPTSDAVGRVSIEPDYESEFGAADLPQLRAELEEVLNTAPVSAKAVKEHDGQELDFAAFPTLTRFVRKIALHGGATATPWIEVIPPGNWI